MKGREEAESSKYTSSSAQYAHIGVVQSDKLTSKL